MPSPSSPSRSTRQPCCASSRYCSSSSKCNSTAGRTAAPYFGKMMVGSLAGLMILEAVRERELSNESPQGRGLFALPMQLLRSLASTPHISIAGHRFATAQLISTAKLLLLFGIVLWAFVPSLFAPKPPKPQKPGQFGATLEAVPSLASPIHVRRQAWLTATQTVWVPQHIFILEVAAIMLKLLKLSLRNAIGSRRLPGVDGRDGRTGDGEGAGLGHRAGRPAGRRRRRNQRQPPHTDAPRVVDPPHHPPCG